MRSIILLLILVMIGLNGKGQSVTALPDSVLSQCCLEVTLLNGNVTTVDWVFIQYITRDGTGTKLFVEYAPNFGGIQWETQIRIQDDFDDVIARSKFIILPFTVGTTDYGINRNWIANIEENTTTGGTWIYGRFGTPTKRKFSAVEDYETMKNLLLACRPRAIVVAENGLYTEGDTVRMGGFLIEPTKITTEGYNWQMKDKASKVEFGLDYTTPWSNDTTVYWGRRFGVTRQMVQLGRLYYANIIEDTIGGLYSRIQHVWNSGNPGWTHQIFNPSSPSSGTMWAQLYRDQISMIVSKESTNPYYTSSLLINSTQVSIGVNESGGGYPGNGVQMGAIGYGSGNELLFLKTKNVDDGVASVGQYLQLKNAISGEVDFATINLSGYLQISDTNAMLLPYIRNAGWGLIKSPYTLRADSTLLATKTYTNRFLLRSDTSAMLAPFIDGFGTVTRIPIFTGSRTIGNSPITYNSTTKRTTWDSPGVIELPMGTTVQRPSPATMSDFWYNTIFGPEFYDGLDWYYMSPWRQSTSSTNVFLNSGSAIVNNSSVINSNYKLQVNGGALYSGATFTTNQSNQAALDIRAANITAQSGTTHGVWGINIEGAMNFNTFNQTYGGIRIATTSNATFSQNVRPLEILFSSAVFGRSSIINTDASNGADFVIGGGGASAPERIVMRSPNGGFSGSSSPGYNYISTSGSYSWAITGIGDGMAVLSNATGTSPNGLNPTLYVEGKRATIGQVFQSTPASTLEIVGEGSTNATSSLLVQNSTRSNNAFRVLNDGTSVFGGASGGSGAILTVTSTTQGFLPPRWTATQRGAISSPATGLIGYQTDGTEGVYVKQSGAFKRLLWEGDAVSTWLKPSLEAGSVNINQGRVNKFRLNQDSGFFHLKNGVVYLQHPTKVSPIYLLPQIVITDDTTALWDKGGAVVSIGSVLGSGNGPGNGYTMVGSNTSGISTGYAGFASSAYGYDSKIDSTFKVNAIGHKITAKLVTDSDAFGGYIVFNRGISNSGAYGSNIQITRNKSFVFGRFINTRHENEFLYGSTFNPKHTFVGTKVMFGTDSTFSFNTSTDLLQLSKYATPATTAAAQGKTQSSYVAGFATDGTVTSLEVKKDTTITITNANYNFGSSITTAQILSRYNRVVIYIKCTSAATANNTITLHVPDANLSQSEIIIHSIDDNSTYRNDINFTTSGAVNALGTAISTYNLSAGQQLRIRVVNDAGWKYFFGF